MLLDSPEEVGLAELVPPDPGIQEMALCGTRFLCRDSWAVSLHAARACQRKRPP